MPSPVARSLICALSAILLDTDAVDNMGCGSMILWTLANLVDNSLDTTRVCFRIIVNQSSLLKLSDRHASFPKLRC